MTWSYLLKCWKRRRGTNPRNANDMLRERFKAAAAAADDDDDDDDTAGASFSLRKEDDDDDDGVFEDSLERI